jgi:hypothetical protein
MVKVIWSKLEKNHPIYTKRFATYTNVKKKKKKEKKKEAVNGKSFSKRKR